MIRRPGGGDEPAGGRGDVGRQADLQEEAEARGLKVDVEREGPEVRVLVEGEAAALVFLAAWALARDTWPDDELRVGADEEEACEEALAADERTAFHLDIVTTVSEEDAS